MEGIMSWKYEMFGIWEWQRLVNYPGSSFHNQSVVFSTQPISETQLSQIAWFISCKLVLWLF